MYTREQLIQYDYFSEALDGQRISDVLDPLTGLVSRGYMLGFVKDLVENNIPFTFGIMDLDNFKYVNDTYGHSTGDGVLQGVADLLADMLDGIGIAGRFGGDEYLFVNLRDIVYDQKKQFCKDMFAGGKVIRRMFRVEEYELFVTATAGIATFPADAKDYDELFSVADKALYFGKRKGRNCYIIYVESKHGHIRTEKIKKATVYELFKKMTECFDSAEDLYGKIRAVYEGIGMDLRVTDFFYAGNNGILKSITDGRVIGPCTDIGKVVQDEIHSTNTLNSVREKSPELYNTLTAHEFETMLAAKVHLGTELYGYLVLAEPRTLRIWQDEEKAVMFFFARMLAGFIKESRQRLE